MPPSTERCKTDHTNSTSPAVGANCKLFGLGVSDSGWLKTLKNDFFISKPSLFTQRYLVGRDGRMKMLKKSRSICTPFVGWASRSIFTDPFTLEPVFYCMPWSYSLSWVIAVSGWERKLFAALSPLLHLGQPLSAEDYFFPYLLCYFYPSVLFLVSVAFTIWSLAVHRYVAPSTQSSPSHSTAFLMCVSRSRLPRVSYFYYCFGSCLQADKTLVPSLHKSKWHSQFHLLPVLLQSFSTMLSSCCFGPVRQCLNRAARSNLCRQACPGCLQYGNNAKVSF